MKKIFSLFVLLALLLHAAPSHGQDLKVFRVSGKVEKVSGGKATELKLKDVVSPTTTISVDYESLVEFLDEKEGKRYTIKTPGKGTVGEMSKSAGNSVKELTRQYLSYIQNQMQKNTKVESAHRYTDFATVTREKKEFKKAKPQTAQEKFQAYKEAAQDSYNAYRRKVFSQYNDFVRKAWEEYEGLPAVEAPQEPDVEPVVISEAEKTDRLAIFDWVKKVVNDSKRVFKSKKTKEKQPEPITEIREVPLTVEEKSYEPMPFTFYGTDMSVRLDESKRFNIGNISPNKIGDVLNLLNTKGYDNVIYDCLQLRKKHNLCDWAYLQMLQAMSDQYCGEGTNEAVLLTGYLLLQSGYKMRFATAGDKLYILVASQWLIYGKSAYEMDGVYYYPVVENFPDRVHVCPASLKTEKALNVLLAPQPKLAVAESAERKITSTHRPSLSAKVKVNKNLISFYNDYPKYERTRGDQNSWIYYAEVPMDPYVSEQLYPQMEALLAGKSDYEAVALILEWIQHGLKYEFDSKVWGGDRIFFAEETLFYPGCDCEDRAILFTRLVRDLLHMKCVLIRYPGHLAAGVHFKENVRGDKFTCENVEYTVCDPTYIGADIGMQQPAMVPLADKARLLILQDE